MNNKGFSLIEVIIAFAILSIIALGTAQMLNNALLVSQTADQKNNVTSLVASTAGIASNAATCTKAITTVSQQYGSTLVFGNLSANANLSDYRLTVNNVSFQNASLVATGGDNTKVYYGNLTVSLKSNIAVLGNKSYAPRLVMAIYVTVAPDNTVTGCSTVMPVLAPVPAPAPVLPPSAVKNIVFDADPKVCENFPISARCPGQKIVIVDSSYGENCGVKANYGLETVQSICNGQEKCDFTAGNVNNCSGAGIFVDPAVGCAKGYHMSYYCK